MAPSEFWEITLEHTPSQNRFLDDNDDDNDDSNVSITMNFLWDKIWSLYATKVLPKEI